MIADEEDEVIGAIRDVDDDAFAAVVDFEFDDDDDVVIVVVVVVVEVVAGPDWRTRSHDITISARGGYSGNLARSFLPKTTSSGTVEGVPACADMMRARCHGQNGAFSFQSKK